MMKGSISSICPTLFTPGRGDKNRGEDAHHQMTRKGMDLLLERAWESANGGRQLDIVTGTMTLTRVTSFVGLLNGLMPKNRPSA